MSLYDALLEALKRENERMELQPLPKSFYLDLSEFVGKLIEDCRTVDESSLRGRLLALELSQLRRLLSELVQLRLRKIMDSLIAGGGPPREGLTMEEEVLVAKGMELVDSVHRMVEDLSEGRKPRLVLESIGSQPGKVLLRFLKETPPIIGVDMRPYGPFKPEDVAFLPMENAELLIKQGAAQRIELTRD
jgi:DNA replication initiation complex subunit (GINS family)